MKKSKLTHYQLCILLILFVGIFSCKQKGNPPVTHEEKPEKLPFVPDTVKLLFAGDVITHSTVFNSAWSEGGDSSYNFTPMFQFLKDYIASADLSVANLEVPFGGMPYSGYPLFSSPPEIADALKTAGFNLLLTANNHVADKGRKGIEGTIDYLDQLNLKHVGSYKDSLSKATGYPLLLEVKGIKLSILNYTYSTNGMPVYKPNLVNLIDTIQILSDIEKAKQQQPDFIIANVHWGFEYQTKEHSTQQEIARLLAKNGVNLIVGTHPHVVQPFDTLSTASGNPTPVIYSIGNFLSNQQWRYSDGGILFEAILVKTEEQTSLHSVAYEPVWVNRSPLHTGDTTYRIIPANSSINYNLNEHELYRMQQFREDTRKILPYLKYSGFWEKEEKSSGNE